MPPIKIGENFEIKSDLIDFLANMVRYPEMMTTDTAAKVAACLRLRERLLDIVAERGVSFTVGLLRRVIDDSATAARERVSRLPDGTYRHVMFLDTYGPGEGLVRVPCELRIEGDSMTADFAGASPELPGPYNAFEHVIYAHCTCILFQFYLSDLPGSSGTLFPLNVHCSEDSFLDVRRDAAISSCTAMAVNPATSFMMCLLKAMFASGDEEIIADFALPNATGTRTFFFGGLDQFGGEIAGSVCDRRTPERWVRAPIRMG